MGLPSHEQAAIKAIQKAKRAAGRRYGRARRGQRVVDWTPRWLRCSGCGRWTSTEGVDGTRPHTGLTMGSALQKAERLRARGVTVSGLGLALGDGLTGIDLDKRIDEHGQLEPAALKIVNQLDTYTELSPSQTGLHLLASGDLPPGSRRKGTLEMYDSGRFFTMTGRHVPGTPETVEERGPQLARLHAATFPPKAPRPDVAPTPGRPLTLDDDELLERMFAAKNAAAIRALWDGAGGNASDSDLGLLNHLAFWTGRDAARMERLFSQSKRNRDKWQDREDYRERTIAKAIDDCREVYEGPSIPIDLAVAQDAGATAEKVSAVPKEGVPAARNLIFHTGREIADATPETIEWIAEPWLARGCVTENDGKAKASGKTTLTTHMCHAILHGLPFLGKPTKQTGIVYLTEQSPRSFREALRRADLLDHDDFLVVYWHESKGIPWPDIVRMAAEEAVRLGYLLLVIDTLAQLAGLRGDEENSAGCAQEAIEPAQDAAATYGLAVWFTRHERKGGGDVGESGRGSSAFTGGVDIVLSLRRGEGNTPDTVRLVYALSRFDETPASLAIELTDTGYVSLGNEHQLALRKGMADLLEALPYDPAQALTLDDALARTTGVKRTVGQEAIGQLIARYEIDRVGAGKRGDPYRFHRKLSAGGKTAPAESNGTASRATVDVQEKVSAGTPSLYTAESNGRSHE